MHQKLTPDPFLILVKNQNSHCMQGILSQIRCFERELSKSFTKDNFIFLSKTNCMSSVCHSYVLVCIIRMSFVRGFTMNRCRYSRSYMMIFSSFQKIDKNLNLDPCILNFLVLGTTSPAAYWLSKQ